MRRRQQVGSPGSVAIVTGGASGIGAALSRALADRGCHVVVADLDGVGAARVANELDSRSPAGGGTAARLDVTDADAVRDLVQRTVRDHGQLDLLVNNAGIAGTAQPEEISLDAWRRSVDVNLWGVVHGCHAAYPVMLSQGHGTILNTASSAGIVGGLAAGLPYATTKHGVVGLSMGLRVAGADRGVRVSVLCPGAVETPLWDGNDYVQGGPTARSALDAVPTPALLEADDLATRTLAALDRNRPIIVEPASMRAAWRLYRLSPSTMLALGRVGNARVRRAASKSVRRRGRAT